MVYNNYDNLSQPMISTLLNCDNKIYYEMSRITEIVEMKNINSISVQ